VADLSGYIYISEIRLGRALKNPSKQFADVSKRILCETRTASQNPPCAKERVDILHWLPYELYGWPAGNPFQSEVAVANLTIGTLGILCYWIRGNFWVATAIGCSVWLMGDAVVHIREIVVEANYAPNNAGMTFYLDILIPVILVALLVYYLHVKRQEEHERIDSGGSLGEVG
jgi:hypothetical protein